MRLQPTDLQAESVLVVVAHPDDEALLCFGTLSRLARMGMKIQIAFLTDGGQGREVMIPQVAQLIDAATVLLEFPVCCLSVDKQLVTAIEEQITFFRPTVLITHSYTPLQHQDHSVVSQAATLAARRSDNVRFILHVEPPYRAEGFHPNCFVAIDEDLDIKIRSINLYREVLDRWFMEPAFIRRRAAGWGTHIDNASQERLYEAFTMAFATMR